MTTVNQARKLWARRHAANDNRFAAAERRIAELNRERIRLQAGSPVQDSASAGRLMSHMDPQAGFGDPILLEYIPMKEVLARMFENRIDWNPWRSGAWQIQVLQAKFAQLQKRTYDRVREKWQNRVLATFERLRSRAISSPTSVEEAQRILDHLQNRQDALDESMRRSEVRRAHAKLDRIGLPIRRR